MEFRQKHQLQRISEIWNLDESARKPVLDQLTELELFGVSSVPYPIRHEINHFEEWAVLSNNSSSCIEKSISQSPELQRPLLIMAREQIQGSKNDFSIFSNAIAEISSQLHWELGSITYWGDQEYEICFAQELGLGNIERRTLGAA